MWCRDFVLCLVRARVWRILCVGRRLRLLGGQRLLIRRVENGGSLRRRGFLLMP